MSHLNLETLARLVDETADPTETGHLDICERCRAELEAMRADANALRMLPDPEPPIAAWLALEQQLKREGIMRRSRWVVHTMRTAATVAVFVLGTVAGVLYTRKQQSPMATSTRAVTGEPVHVARAPLHIDTAPATLVNSPIINAVPRPAANAQEATDLLRQAERDYLAALTRFTEFSSRAESGDPVARLAALESIVATTRAALGQAPADPVINGYHLTAVAQRDATLRQIAAKQQTWY